MSLVLNVEILGEYKKLALATAGAQSTISQLGTKFVAVGKQIGTIVAGIGVGLGVAVGSQIKPAIDAASDLEQQFGALESVFKDLAPGMQEFASNQYKIGLSTADAARSMVLLGSQLKGYGLPVDEAATKTKDLTLLAADLAATFGGTTADAVSSISALFRGEYDPIEKYGIALKKSDVNARLAAEGLDKLEGESLKQAEAQAALTILYEKSTDAQGQANREVDTAAARSQRLTAELTNLRAEIGEKLLPIFVEMISYITEEMLPMFEAFWSELTDPAGDFTDAVMILQDQLAVLFGQFQDGSDDAWSLVDALTSVVKFISSVTWEVTKLTIMFDALNKSWGYWVSGQWDKAITFDPAKYIKTEISAAQNELRLAEARRSAAVPDTSATPYRIEVNINRAKVSADDILDEVNSALKSRGLTTIGVQ